MNRVAALIAVLLLAGCGPLTPEEKAAKHCASLSGEWRFICEQHQLAELKRSGAGQ